MATVDAVEQFLANRDLDGRALVLGAIAQGLARQLDVAIEAGSARGLSAGPPIARRLMEALAELEEASQERETVARVERVVSIVKGLSA
jgi:hypothetical protein